MVKSSLWVLIALSIFEYLGQNTAIAQSFDKRSVYQQDQSRSVNIGVGIGYGITSFIGRNQSNGFLARPSFSALLLHRLDTKNHLLYRVQYHSFGNTFSAGQEEKKAYNQLDFIGVSIAYQRKLFPNKPFYFGIGLMPEKLLKDQTTIILQDGTKFSGSSFQTYKNINWGSQLLGKYYIEFPSKFTAILGMEYNLGLVNFLKPVATEKSGRTLHTNGLFINVDFLF